MERMMVVETTSPVWKTGVLPLNYIRILAVNRRTTYFASYITLPRATDAALLLGLWQSVSRLVAQIGLEPISDDL